MVSFDSNAKGLIDRAKSIARAHGSAQLGLEHLLAAICRDSDACHLLSKRLNLDAGQLRSAYPSPPGDLIHVEHQVDLTDDLKRAVQRMQELQHERRESTITLRTLIDAIADAGLPNSKRHQHLTDSRSLDELTGRIRAIRDDLMHEVLGQDSVIHQFVEGLFDAEVLPAQNDGRPRPRGVFLFAGPPGVGKTHLAELAARKIERPYRVFNMTSYSQAHQVVQLVGAPRSYERAAPGVLTQFVLKNPRAFLIFDEIDKADASAIDLFLQVLDAGRLRDVYDDADVDFSETIIVFTTNLGRTLYERQNTFGVQQDYGAFHRSTLLDALANELDPRTRQPAFPPALCSRLGAGRPLLFSPLGVHHLAAIAENELSRVAREMHDAYGIAINVEAEIAQLIVMREGGISDARSVRSRSEQFLKDEMFRAARHLPEQFSRIAAISIELESPNDRSGEAQRIFRAQPKPVLIIGRAERTEAIKKSHHRLKWEVAHSRDEVLARLEAADFGFALLDLELAAEDLDSDTHLISADVPPESRRFRNGQLALEALHTRAPDLPVFIIALRDIETEEVINRVGHELLASCARAGGARGVIEIPTRNGVIVADSEYSMTKLRDRLDEISRNLTIEAVAADYRRRSDAVIFDCAPKFSDDGKRLHIRARNIRRVRAVRSADTASVLSDVERPTTRFDSVIGGKEAKDVLKSVQEWLVAPKQLTAAGLPLPKGVLLVGRPGTGKTMLARALAGESSCAFLERAATSFVTTWQGSGAQNVRDLFAAARRYAPSVLFIDEIDAMGRDRARVNGGGAGFGEAMALNQLLVEMDGFSQPGNRPVIVIAATNHAEVLDLALLRRFSRVVEVEPPTRDERIQFLWNRVTARADHKVKREVIEQIGANSAGFTVADLERILGEAARAAYKAKRPLDDAILEDAFGKIVYGPEKQGADLERTARHEAGHAVVMCLLGNPPTYATIVGRGNFGGYVAREVEEGSRSHSKQELKDLICQCLGGLEAECLYYGPDGGPSTGPASDLEQASKIAESMVLDLGMSDELGTVRIDRRQLVGVLAELGHAAVRKIIDEQRTRVAQLIREHRSALERVSLALFQKQRLLQREILDLMNPRPES